MTASLMFRHSYGVVAHPQTGKDIVLVAGCDVDVPEAYQYSTQILAFDIQDEVWTDFSASVQLPFGKV